MTESTANGDIATSPSDGFPNFADGDIHILSSTGRLWKLHAATLRSFSTFFRTLIDGHEALRAIKRRKDDVKLVRWKILMVPWEKDSKEKRFRSFNVIDTNKQNLLIPENIDGIGNRSPPYNKVYDNVFRCIYALEPKLSVPVDSDMKDFMADVISLLQAAEHLGAGPSVRRTIEANCLRLNQLVFKHIARNSAAWCDIALRIQSTTLFRTAMAHLVGRFDLPGRDGIDKQFLKAQPNGDLLMELASKKAAELKDKKLRIERLLLEYYPPKMHHPQMPSQKVPGRDDYIEDIYLWQALTIVRQYISSAFLSHMNHRAQDGGTWLYQCIAAGGDAYLRREGLERFHVEFAMSAKGKDCLRLAVANIKGSLCEFVQPLLVDGSNIHRTEEDPKPRYLTCCEIDDDELPW